MKNRKEFSGKHQVPTDETYIENINLVTGAKLNYDRPLSTQRQINELCINEELNRTDKFCLLIEEGEKIQKWSILENLTDYVGKQGQKIFSILTKNYSQLLDFLPIMGEGLSLYLSANYQNLNKKNISILYNLIYRTLTQHPDSADDWILAFAYLVKTNQIQHEQIKQYINNSFGMNSSPERRKVALMMTEKMFEYSKDIRQSCRSRVLFFNHDQNAKVRETICVIMEKILINNNNDEQIWKQIWQYYNDKDINVKGRALKTLTTIFHKSNFSLIYDLLDSEDDVTIFIPNLKSFLLVYQDLIVKDTTSKTKIVYFCNRIFRSKETSHICQLFQMFQTALLPVLGQSTIAEQFTFLKLQLSNQQIFPHLLQFYHLVHEIQFKEQLKQLLLRGLKDSKYLIMRNMKQFGEMLDLKQEEDISAFYLVCQKLCDKSKWVLIEDLLKYFPLLRMYQTFYEKFSILLLKIWFSCPLFIMETVIDSVIFMMLSNRKSLEFLITIREKMMNSKNWIYRRNYIIFYAQLKRKCSFQFNKLIPTFVYKNVVAEKALGVKLAFLEVAASVFQYIDPVLSNEKQTLRDTVLKMTEDKDRYVKEKAREVEETIKKIERDGNWLHKLYERNRELIVVEEQTEQVIADPKQTVKTENDIRKSFSRRKGYDNKKKTLNLIRDTTQKEISFDVLNKIERSSDPKKVNLFRCHSVKIKVPSKKK